MAQRAAGRDWELFGVTGDVEGRRHAERANQGGSLPDDGRALEAHAARVPRSAAAPGRATSPAAAGS